MATKPIALIFPGQGSQKIGMGKFLYDNFPLAKDIFDEVDDTLNYKLSKLMFEGPIEELNLTQNSQVAIMSVSMAYFNVLKNIKAIDLSDIKFVAGHSLGEYSALCAAQALSLRDTTKLLQLRGQYMAEACAQNTGSMLAIIGLDFNQVKSIADNTMCYVSNSNSPLQIVISGNNTNLAKAQELAMQQGARRAIPLNVSGAFHSPLMQSAADKMAKTLNEIDFHLPKIKTISNITAQEYSSISQIKELLAIQITNTVKWQESINYIINHQINDFIEVGYGNILTGLVKKIAPQVNIITSEDLIKNI